MRNAFVRALTEAAARDTRIMLLTADLGYKIFDDFASRYPARFMNVGIAEANMTGVAVGLAMEGRKPFIYSIAPFATLRNYEQIRNDICYHQADVTVVGVGGGYSYGPNGPTHHALEDIGAMRMLPHMTVVCPGDPAETAAAVHAIAAHRGPCYLRLGRAGEPVVHKSLPSIRLGEGLRLREGSDVALLSSGNMLATGMATADLLAARGIRSRVVSMHTVKPLDVAEVLAAARETRLVATLEEHYLAGGFGSAVAEMLADLDVPARLRRFGAADRFAQLAGDQAYHREANGLTPSQVASAIEKALS
jgi:transketolase